MVRKAFPKIKAADTQRVLNVRGDPPDIRDRIYEPALVRLKSEIDHREPGLILDQGQEGACTGFGLTAVINLLNLRRGTPDRVGVSGLPAMATSLGGAGLQTPHGASQTLNLSGQNVLLLQVSEKAPFSWVVV